MKKALILTCFCFLIHSCGGTIGGIDMYTSCKCDYIKTQRTIKEIATKDFRNPVFNKLDTSETEGASYINLYIQNPNRIRVTCILYYIKKNNSCNLIFTHIKENSGKSKVDRELNIYERYKYQKLIEDSVMTVLNTKYKMSFKHE